jgi:hypothetical protein
LPSRSRDRRDDNDQHRLFYSFSLSVIVERK